MITMIYVDTVGKNKLTYIGKGKECWADSDVHGLWGLLSALAQQPQKAEWL